MLIKCALPRALSEISRSRRMRFVRGRPDRSRRRGEDKKLELNDCNRGVYDKRLTDWPGCGARKEKKKKKKKNQKIRDARCARTRGLFSSEVLADLRSPSERAMDKTDDGGWPISLPTRRRIASCVRACVPPPLAHALHPVTPATEMKATQGTHAPSAIEYIYIYI